MQAVDVTISNPVSAFTRTATTDAAGKYAFGNLPPNPYHLAVDAQGFEPLARDVDVRTAVPITLDLTLALAGTATLGRRRRACRGPAGARPERAHRHRPEPDREAAARTRRPD